MKWDTIKLLLFAGAIIAISYFFAPRKEREGTDSLKSIFAFSLTALRDDIVVAWRIIKQNRWLFILPFAFCIFETLISQFIAAMFVPEVSPELLKQYKANSSFININVIIQSILTQIDSYMYFIQESIASYYIAPAIFLMLIFYKKTGSWVNSKAEAQIWQPIGRYLIVSFCLLLASTPLLYFQYISLTEIHWSQNYAEAIYFIGSLLETPFTLVQASFFGSGVIYSISALSIGNPVTLRTFLQNAAKYFKPVFWANMIINFFWLPIPQSFLNIPYIDSKGAITSFYIGSLITPLGLLLMAVPFLIVCYNFTVFKALAKSITLTLKHAGKFLPVFLLGGVALFILPLLATIFFGVLIPTLSLDKVIMLHIATFNVFLACIIAIAFYRTLERAMREEKQATGSPS